MAEYHIGVDEAGKGPVLGPMIAAAVRIDDEVDLPDGVADSKQLTVAKRESLAAELRDVAAVDTAVGVITTDEIDAPETDMNGLTVIAQVRALTGVASDGDRALVDAGDVSESRFGRRVQEAVVKRGVDIDVTAEHGADDDSRLVGAASIIAKIERDRRITAIDEEYDTAVGSGYPSDPTTRQFLADYVDHHDELPACTRTSWATCEDVLAAAEQSELAEF
jgi:ribonuclease H, mammalian HI/archaeal HII subfamily